MGYGANSKEELLVFQNNTSQILTVNNPNALELKSVTLFDINGKRIFGQERLGIQSSYQFSTAGLAEAVYLVEVVANDRRKMIQKIIISSH